MRSIQFASMIAVGFALTPAAGAVDWKNAGKTYGGNDVFVDLDGVRVGGDVRTAWVRVDYARPVELPNGSARSMQALAHFDCPKGASAGIRVIFYADAATGRVLLVNEEETVRMSPDPDGSFGKLAGQAICAR